MSHCSDTGPEPKPKLRGDSRTFRVWLDPNQYQQDMTSSIQAGTEDPYETFNIIMRRKPKENNFKVRSATTVFKSLIRPILDVGPIQGPSQWKLSVGTVSSKIKAY